MDKKTFVVLPEEAGERVDVFITRKVGGECSRSHVKRLILEGAAKKGAEPLKPHYILKQGDCIVFDMIPPPATDVVAQDIPLNIIYEDDDIIVINKPAGMVVHPAAGNWDATLVNALKHHVGKRLSSCGGTLRQGIVHRLDKETSGVLVTAKTDYAHAALAAQFKNHSVVKKYRVVVRGVVQHNEGVCEVPIQKGTVNKKRMVVELVHGKEAITEYRVMERFSDATLLEITLHTGRTHQIRVHMAYMGHPVFGDSLYGYAMPLLIDRQALHAYQLGFAHPRTKKNMMFEAPMPIDIENVLATLRNNK